MKLDPLYLITDREVPRSKDFLGALKAALEGGVRFIQFREKDLPPRARLELGEKVMALARAHDATVIVNSDPALAEILGSAGVHLGRDSFPIRAVRERLGYQGLIGYSAHSGPEAAEAFAEGADFIVLSPVFPTLSKYSPGPFLGPEGFRAELEHLPPSRESSPVYALGGMTAENARDCLQAGAHGVALVGGILGAANPATAALEIREAMKR